MSVSVMSIVFESNIPDLKTDDGKNVPDSTAKFVLLALADHASEDGRNAYCGVKRICRKTSMSASTVCNALNALRHNGYTTYEGKSKSETNNYTINIDLLQRLEFQPSKSKRFGSRNSGVSATEIKPSINHQSTTHAVYSKPKGKEFKDPVIDTIATSQAKNPILIARNAFERDMKFGTCSKWATNQTWTRFEKWVAAEYEKDNACFAKYKKWADTKYTKGAFSTKDIRNDPDAFMETGWSNFLASTEMSKPTIIDRYQPNNAFEELD